MDWLSNLVLLHPMGQVALAERGLMLQVTLFMLIVAVPVFALIFFFAWWYRAGNTKAKYTPEWAHSNMEELIWWAIPLEIVLIVGALTWTSTHELDPRRPLSTEQPLVVQVVALDWKWLFIYPSLGIASVNYLEIPAGVPVRFDITADAPMNSFWIPALGGQMYAMTGMSNTLNLEATLPGRFAGRAANYSGLGFADMHFVVQADTKENFDAWAASVKASYPTLDLQVYKALSQPSTTTPASFGSVAPNLYNTVVMQFMDASSTLSGEHTH